MNPRKFLATLFMVFAASIAAATDPVQLARPTVPELEYLKVVNDNSPVDDPRLVFLLMAHYQSAQRTQEGIEHFETLLKRFDGKISSSQRAVYLTALGLLRANHAAKVSFMSRIGWVNETKRVFSDAKKTTKEPLFIARWGHGIFQVTCPLPAVPA
ncbi:MAG: hypothetical protein K2X51_10075 [Burkholderiales bacterium]|nr:hypothetical protein [Burkholderiales bacterium]